MEKNQYIKLALKVLNEVQQPMSSNEIWEYAKEKGYISDIITNGKTPEKTFGAQLYANNKANTYFEKIGARPIRFVLKELINKFDTKKLQEKQYKEEIKEKNFSYLEEDLHPILVYYLNTYMNIHAKTVNHSKSNKKEYGEWIHPDIVGCYFPFEDWNEQVYELNKTMSDSPVTLYSFELKRELNFSNLRKYFFQAVSNSSWANEGYLVASEIDKSEEFRYELKRLSISYGIGIIEIDTTNPDNTTIIFPSKHKDEIDWETINKITRLENKDFIEFIKCLNDSIKVNRVQSGCFDKIKNRDSLILN